MAATQANPGLLEKEVSGMGYALAKQIDIFIEGLIEAQDTASHVDLATDNQLTAAEIRSALQLLMENDVPTEECNMVIHPAISLMLVSMVQELLLLQAKLVKSMVYLFLHLPILLKMMQQVAKWDICSIHLRLVLHVR